MDTRHEVQEFLTALRGRITPEKAGLTAFGGERRVPGLRREEVAQLAGVSTAYYTRMERGDLGGVSESVLYALVNALQLTDAESQHLFDLARAATGTRRPTRPRPDTRLSPQITQLMETMRDVPAVALSKLGDPLGSNSLVGELATRSTEFRTWWGSHTVRTHSTGTKRINHPVVGEMTLSYQTLTLQNVANVRLATYLAEAGTPSADALDLLRSWAATPIPADRISRTRESGW